MAGRREGADSFDPQALTSLTKYLFFDEIDKMGFDPQALTSLTGN